MVRSLRGGRSQTGTCGVPDHAEVGQLTEWYWLLLSLPSGVHHRVDRLGDLARAERNAAHEVEAGRIDEELRADQLPQLPEIDLRHEHLLVAPQNLARV